MACPCLFHNLLPQPFIEKRTGGDPLRPGNLGKRFCQAFVERKDIRSSVDFNNDIVLEENQYDHHLQDIPFYVLE
jgi:hypothetical protein